MKILSDAEYKALTEQKQKDNAETYYKDKYEKLDKLFQEYKINSAQTEEIKKLQKKRNEEDKLKDLIAHYYSKG